MVSPTPQEQVAHGGISGSATQGDFVKPHLGPQATLPRGLFTISAFPERCPRQMQQWLPLSLSACLSQAVHNLYPCAQCLTHWPPSDLITIREFTSQGCLHLVTCWCLLPAALRFVPLMRGSHSGDRGGSHAEPVPSFI